MTTLELAIVLILALVGLLSVLLLLTLLVVSTIEREVEEHRFRRAIAEGQRAEDSKPARHSARAHSRSVARFPARRGGSG